MAGNGLNIIRKYMIDYFPKSKMAANQSGSQMAYFDWTPYLELYNILLAFFNLIEV